MNKNPKVFWFCEVLGLALLLLMGRSGLAGAPTSGVLFYVGFEGGADGHGRDRIYPNGFTSKGEPLTIFSFEPGIIGRGARFTWENGYPGIQYPAAGNFDPTKGTLSIWFRKTDAFFINRYYPSIWGVGSEKEVDKSGWALVSLNDPRVAALDDGKWHYFVYTWDSSTQKRQQYFDGELLAEGDYRSPYGPKDLIFGYRLTGSMDELVILDTPLSAGEVKALYGAYGKGQQPFLLPKPTRKDYPYPLDISSLPATRPALPAGTDWTLKPVQDSGKRVLYELTGLWRFQPAVVERKEKEVVNPGYFGQNWAYAKVPGNWHDTKSGVVVDETGKGLANWRDQPLTAYQSGWYERDFSLPAHDQGKSVFLHFPRVIGMAEVYVNGQRVGSVTTSEEKQFLITRYLVWGKPNRLTIQNGLPFVPEMKVEGFPVAPRLEVRETSEFHLGAPLINSSVRKKTLDVTVFFENLSKGKLDLSLFARVLEYRSDTPVKTFGPVNLKVIKGFAGEKNLSFPVEGLKCWSPEEPNLYRLVLEVRKGDKVIDSTFPEAFGYREIWVEGSTIYLNGFRLSIRGKSHNYLGGYGFTEREIGLLKATGQNADRTHSPQPEWEKTLQVTDEQGWLVFYHTGNDPAQIKKILRRIGNHPSLIGWQVWGNGYINGPHGHPMQIGGKVPEDIKASDPSYQAMKKLSDADPYHLNVYYRLGAGGHVRSIMHYMGFGTPIQAIEEWPSYWAKERPEPFVPMEITPIPISHEPLLWQKGSKEVMLVEHCARYFGETAYQKVDDTLANTYAAADFGEKQWLESSLRYDLKSMVLQRVLRAWRTYGINGYLLHVDGKADQNYTAGKLNRQGEALTRNNSPLLFYLAGPEQDFISKDHHYLANEGVEKSAVIINDRFSPLSGTVSWQVQDASGKVLTEKTEKVSVAEGGRLFVPITFSAPVTKERQKLVIRATLQDETGKVLAEDSLPLQVFPQPSFVWDRGIKVALIDSSGQTGKVLEQMGVPYRLVNKEVIDQGFASLQGYSLLIIGKDSYPEAAEIFKSWMPVSGAVEEGLNVVCLEQLNRYVMGLRAEHFNTREVFIRAKDSPLFAGLGDENFANWNGEGNRLPAYPSWCASSDWKSDNYSKHGQRNSFGQLRNWHWSNKGMVATFCFEKPQMGSFRVLLENGFDLLFTPLVEFYQGKGRVVLSQLDLVDHYGMDPVATLLFQRLLQEYSKPQPRSLARLTYLGVGKRENILQETGVEYQKSSRVEGEVVYLEIESFTRESAPELSAALGRFLENGGKGVMTLTQPEDTWVLPLPVAVAQRTVFKTTPPALPVFSGIGVSDFFWRGKKDFLCVATDGGQLSDSGLVGVVRHGKGEIILIQVEPKSLEGFWQRSKILRIYNTLFTHLGVQSKVKLDFTAIGGYGKPEEWLPGYGVAVTEMEERPMVKESNVYQKPALDFDPDQHHVW